MLNKLNALLLVVRDTAVGRYTQRGGDKLHKHTMGVQIFSECLQCKSEHSDGIYVGMVGCEFNIFGCHFLSTEYKIHNMPTTDSFVIINSLPQVHGWPFCILIHFLLGSEWFMASLGLYWGIAEIKSWLLSETPGKEVFKDKTQTSSQPPFIEWMPFETRANCIEV